MLSLGVSSCAFAYLYVSVCFFFLQGEEEDAVQPTLRERCHWCGRQAPGPQLQRRQGLRETPVFSLWALCELTKKGRRRVGKKGYRGRKSKQRCLEDRSFGTHQTRLVFGPFGTKSETTFVGGHALVFRLEKRVWKYEIRRIKDHFIVSPFPYLFRMYHTDT